MNVNLQVSNILNQDPTLQNENFDMNAEFEKIRRLDKIYRDFPIWPFNYSILIAFITTQAIPLLGLTGLGSSTINAMGSTIEFLSHMIGT